VALTKQSLGLAIVLWPASVLLVVVLVLALTVKAPFRDPAFRRFVPVMFVTYGFPLLVLLVGTVFRYKWPAGNPSVYVEPSALHVAVLWAVIAAHAVALIASPIFMRGVRIRSAAIVLPGFWLTLSAGFVAAIAIAGVGP
jgi:hypothetical protein